MFKLLLLALVAVAPLQGCATLQGPQRAAATAETAQERLELRGYAIEKSYNIILEDALAIASAPTTTEVVKARIQSASATGTDAIDQLSDSLARFAVERAKVDAGQSTVEKLTVVADNLQDWVNRASVALIALQAAFR